VGTFIIEQPTLGDLNHLATVVQYSAISRTDELGNHVRGVWNLWWNVFQAHATVLEGYNDQPKIVVDARYWHEPHMDILMDAVDAVFTRGETLDAPTTARLAEVEQWARSLQPVSEWKVALGVGVAASAAGILLSLLLRR